MGNLGITHTIDNIVDEYRGLAMHDEKVAKSLAYVGEYKHAMYFTLQSMEKYIRSTIFSKLNSEYEYNRQINRSHSLLDAIDLLVQLITTDTITQESIKEQLKIKVLGNINYQQLHNSLRYPYYSNLKKSYQKKAYVKKDYESLSNSLNNLKLYLLDLNRMNF